MIPPLAGLLPASISGHLAPYLPSNAGAVLWGGAPSVQQRALAVDRVRAAVRLRRGPHRRGGLAAATSRRLTRDTNRHEGAPAGRIPSGPHRGPLGIRRAGHRAGRWCRPCPALYSATAPATAPRRQSSCWPSRSRRCWSGGSGPSRCSAGSCSPPSPRDCGTSSAIDGLALLIALYTVATTAAAPGRAGLRRPCSRSSWSPRCSCIAGGSWWFDRDLPVRPDRRRSRARPVLRHPPRLPRRAARPRRTAGTRARPASRARRGGRARQDRPRDARHRRPPPHRHDHAERSGDRRVGQLAGAGHRRHAQRGGHRAARAGRYPPAPRRPARAPRPGRRQRRGPAAGPRPHPARHAHRAGPVRRTGHHAGDPRAGTGRARRACS